MFKNGTLCILITVIFCFLQIVEVNANLWRERSQDGIFIAMVIQEKDILIQASNIAVIGVSDQSTWEKGRSIIGKKVEKVIISAIAFFLESLMFKAVKFFKTWATEALSQAFENWRDSLYQ
ncbi:hypothetical protein [Bartonella gliris]|uniref:hypothetical protein n=1 Tax=Bartonella gliris TaxID=3004109 RepID=UPI00295EEBA8|nr:hypothetical protein [Bartonella gliris]